MTEFDPRRPAQVAELLQRPAVRELVAPWIEGDSQLELLSDAAERGIVYRVNSQAATCALRFPLNGSQEGALQKEANIVARIRDLVRIQVPDTTFFPRSADAPALAVHRWIAGEPLTTELYSTLDDSGREKLSDDLAAFIVALHRLDRDVCAGWCGIKRHNSGQLDLSALGLPAWFDQQMRDQVSTLPVARLGDRLADVARQTLAEFEALTVTKEQLVFGHGDIHGYNLAMRGARDRFRLSGIFDFGVAGILDANEDFFRLHFVASDLVSRVVASYTAQSHKADLPQIDLDRIDLYWRAFLLYLMAEHLAPGYERQFATYRQFLIAHLDHTG